MNIGILIWCLGFLFFFIIYLYHKVGELRGLIEHFGFRIITDIAVESEDTQKKIELMMERALRKVLSEMKINSLNEKGKDNNH